MNRTMRMGRNIVFGAVVTGSLGFGASQATAAPRSALACNGLGEVPVSSCPADGRCNDICEYGVCFQNCCTCPI